MKANLNMVITNYSHNFLWILGLFHGFGVMKYKSEEKYEGEWDNSKLNLLSLYKN